MANSKRVQKKQELQSEGAGNREDEGVVEDRQG